MLVAGFLGLTVGLILALTGAGGGILAVPLLMFALTWDITQAAPVALLAVGASAALGAVIGLRQRVVRYRAAMLIAVTGSVVTPLGVLLAHAVPTPPLTIAFAAVLLVVAFRTFRQAMRPAPDLSANTAASAPCKIDPESGRFAWNLACARWLLATGALVGFLSGLLGVGGGFVLIPALKRATDLSMHSIIATSLAVIALVSTAAVMTTWIAGTLEVAVGLPFVAGALAGMLVGRSIAGLLPAPRMQQGFALVAGFVALGLIATAIAAPKNL